MNGRTAGAGFLAGVVCLGVAGCSDASSDAAPSSATGVMESPPPITAGEVLFEDSFDDDRNGWGVVDDPEYGTTVFDGGDYVWAFKGSVSHWLPEVLGTQYDNGELDMLDVVVRSEATIVEGDGVAGVFCRENPDTDAEWQWYEFVARDGFAAIRLADLEGNLETLAETDEVSLPTGEPIAFEAACVDSADGVAQLSLALNGAPVLQAAHGDPLENGVSGLQAYTFPQHDQLDIRWHEFTVHRAQP
ncbi:MAG TPA: hypothetical protein VHI11_00100 [Jiangellaceae bacterium]|nr:hypothetical protein [Jiangellaceae bacterium]